MTQQRGFFDPPSASPPVAPPPAPTPYAAGRFGDAGVARVIEHKAGPFRRLVDGKPEREYRLIELHDGRLFCEFTDNGERLPAPPACNAQLIADCLRFGTWREVRA